MTVSDGGISKDDAVVYYLDRQIQIIYICLSIPRYQWNLSSL
jgi:hypothetical protein